MRAGSLRILHVMRAPVGGLFRHVVDLARAQAARGHAVGVIADATSGGGPAAEALAALAPDLPLGVTRIAMSRHVGVRDAVALVHVRARARAAAADVLHGHGAKGGAYARLTPGPWLRVYTPHGGSLHFSPRTPAGFAYLAVERWLKRRSDLVLFESDYSRAIYEQRLGAPPLARVVHNGISPEELERVQPDADAADFVYVGELRRLKGVDLLIEALALLSARAWKGAARLYGEGPDRAAFAARIAALGLDGHVELRGYAPVRTAFRSGRILVLPSRAESLPYIALEAAGAGMPIVATRVGGVPEIFGPDADALVEPGDADALAQALARALAAPDPDRTRRLHERVAGEFSLDAMADAILAAYAAAARR